MTLHAYSMKIILFYFSSVFYRREKKRSLLRYAVLLQYFQAYKFIFLCRQQKLSVLRCITLCSISYFIHNQKLIHVLFLTYFLCSLFGYIKIFKDVSFCRGENVSSLVFPKSNLVLQVTFIYHRELHKLFNMKNKTCL